MNNLLGFTWILIFNLHCSITDAGKLFQSLRNFDSSNSIVFHLFCTSGLKSFLTAESTLRMMKNPFYFMLKAFCDVGKLIDKKSKVNFKIHEVTDWTAENYSAHTGQYKWRQSGNKIW